MEISCKNLTMRFGDKTALENVSLELKSGNLIGLIGSNGAGKSTLINLLATLKKPTSGDIFLNGKSILKNPNSMRKILGYVPQNVPIYPELSASEFLFYMAAAKGIQRTDAKKQIPQLLEKFHLSDTGSRPLAAFSGGMRQRVGLSVALLGDPKVVIADEPSTGLDPEERVGLRNFLSELSTERIVLLSTHIVSDIEAVAGQILLLKKGNLVYNGSPEDLMTTVDGQVWEYTLPHGTLPPETAVISSLVQTAQGVCVREIAEHVPKGGAAVVATLEDACLSALKVGV
ncbi:ATP-binding cassette domain-containing protein [Enterococcus faecalis]|uniref:ATP-binding cassette domain-containing protein n=1 Tax=Enterococcus faecalis TaxID=1351 RepID=UPI0032DE69F5